MKTPVSDIGTGSKRVSHTLKTRNNLLKMFPGRELATTLRHAGLSAGSSCRSTPSTAKSAPKSSALSRTRGRKRKMSKNANKTPKYQVIAQGNAVILTMTKNAAQLVADALDIINPDEAQNEDLARAIALDIQNAL